MRSAFLLIKSPIKLIGEMYVCGRCLYQNDLSSEFCCNCMAEFVFFGKEPLIIADTGDLYRFNNNPKYFKHSVKIAQRIRYQKESHTDIQARNRQILELAKTVRPATIARKFKMSRERVRQILNKNHFVPPEYQYVYKCETPKCPKNIVVSIEQDPPYFCSACRNYERIHRLHPEIGKVNRHFEMGICIIDGCEVKARSKGYCANHRARFYYRTRPEYREYLREKGKEWRDREKAKREDEARKLSLDKTNKILL